jgi:hypothetical protein
MNPWRAPQGIGCRHLSDQPTSMISIRTEFLAGTTNFPEFNANEVLATHSQFLYLGLLTATNARLIIDRGVGVRP